MSSSSHFVSRRKLVPQVVMSASLPAVERLEDSTARLVEAASQISGLEHALARLLENSFQAGARCIRVSLRLSRLGFSVSDDGAISLAYTYCALVCCSHTANVFLPL